MLDGDYDRDHGSYHRLDRRVRHGLAASHPKLHLVADVGYDHGAMSKTAGSRMTKSAAQLEREIAQAMSPIAPILKSWRAGIAAYRRALASLESGSDDWQSAPRARNRLDKIIHKAAGYAPGNYNDPSVQELQKEVLELPSIEAARSRGRIARSAHRDVEIKQLREEERKSRPYDWMKRR